MNLNLNNSSMKIETINNCIDLCTDRLSLIEKEREKHERRWQKAKVERGFDKWYWIDRDDHFLLDIEDLQEEITFLEREVSIFYEDCDDIERRYMGSK